MKKLQPYEEFAEATNTSPLEMEEVIIDLYARHLKAPEHVDCAWADLRTMVTQEGELLLTIEHRMSYVTLFRWNGKAFEVIPAASKVAADIH